MVAPWLRLVREPGATATPVQAVNAPADVARIMSALALEEVEEFHVLCLNAQNAVNARALVTRGILNSSLVHPREVFRLAIANGAASIIVVHNHPSGNPAPSADDRAVTKELVDAGRIIDIPVYDHIIIGARADLSFVPTYFSFAEAGLL